MMIIWCGGRDAPPTIEESARAEMILKVKEPIAPSTNSSAATSWSSPISFASSEPLTQAMIDSRGRLLRPRNRRTRDRSLPLLIPMSEVAGRMATQEGRYFLEKAPRRQRRAAGQRSGGETRQGLRDRRRGWSVRLPRAAAAGTGADVDLRYLAAAL